MAIQAPKPCDDRPDLREMALLSSMPTNIQRRVKPRDVKHQAYVPSCLLHTLLATKLHIPRPHTQLVARPRLLERLEQGAKGALTLVSAPAGFGKTTLLAQWLATKKAPVAWLSLEPADNEPVRFLSYVIAALQSLDADIGRMALALLQSSHDVSMEVILTALTNDLARRDIADFTLFLDDYHVVSAEPLSHAMTFLLEHLPPQMHVLLSTRVDPALPLSRLRARGQLTELRAEDLRFTPAEASSFLQDVMELDLPARVMVELEQRTEGWIVGLQLAALSLRGREDIDGILTAFTGCHHFILDYLSEEVLACQPTPVYSFLLHTCVLERLSGPLCDVLTGQQNGQEMLERLYRNNLFVTSLDPARQWYRYHSLFADVLRSRLRQTYPALVAELYRQASCWYEQQGLLGEAVRYALQIANFSRAADLLEQCGLTITEQGQVHTVLALFEALPEALVRSRPGLCVAYANVLLLDNQAHACERYLQEAQQHLQGLSVDTQHTIMGQIASIRGYGAFLRGDISTSLAWASDALKLLPEGESLWRAGNSMLEGYGYQISGEATTHIENRVVENAFTPSTVDNSVIRMLGMGQLALLQVLRGQLQQAGLTYKHLSHFTSKDEELPSMIYSKVAYCFGMGNLLREWNELEAAERHLQDGMQLMAKTRVIDVSSVVIGYNALALLQQAKGDHERALETIDSFLHLAHQRQYVQRVVRLGAALQVQVALAEGNLEAALVWMKACGLSCADEVNYLCEREYLTLARVCIALGRERQDASFLRDALLLLERFLKDAEAKGRTSSVIEILVLCALALQAQHQLSDALDALQRALFLTMPEKYIRIFVDEGAPMAILLRHARTHGLFPGYVATLLAAFAPARDEGMHQPDVSSGAMAPPLTERELDVLRLLEAGASNNEIARQLVVSVNTVKKHVFNLCSKLGAQSRTHAIARARELKMV